MAPQAMPARATLRQPNGPARPFTFGSRFSSGTTTSSSTISPVIEVRSESLPSIFGRREPLGAALDQEAADDAVELGPDHREVSDRRVGDPHLGAGEPVAARRLLRARHHRAGIGAVIGLGQAEAADDLARCELRQILLALRLAAIGEDRVHDERGLHRHGRAVAGIDALDLARDQPIGDIAEPGAAVLFRDGGAEQAERAHLGDDGAVEALLAVVQQHAREQLVLRVAARGVAHHALFFRELALEIERILPVERGVLELRRGPMLALLGGLRHGMLPGWRCGRTHVLQRRRNTGRPGFLAHVHPPDSRALPSPAASANGCRRRPEFPDPCAPCYERCPATGKRPR